MSSQPFHVLFNVMEKTSCDVHADSSIRNLSPSSTSVCETSPCTFFPAIPSSLSSPVVPTANRGNGGNYRRTGVVLGLRDFPVSLSSSDPLDHPCETKTGDGQTSPLLSPRILTNSLYGSGSIMPICSRASFSLVLLTTSFTAQRAALTHETGRRVGKNH